MSYQVKMTYNAISQLRDIVEYISVFLGEGDIAKHWSDRIKKAIFSLDQMPFRYPLVNEEPWRSEGIHKMVVENFIVYYWVSLDTSTVWISAIVYGRRDQINALRKIKNE
ncbi:MAG: type II toxin-antitoxin system RelE/ParE family toxin [Clostridia bacterium]|nr:type II toxin-antitoxin system RelE/ParE family toxin [Clostridia bacterium]